MDARLEGINLNGLNEVGLRVLADRALARALAMEEVQSQHHPLFVESIGLDTLVAIRTITSEALGLHSETAYPEKMDPSLMGDETAFRGIDGLNRPFIAIRVSLFDRESGEKVTEVVEIIFKRYKLDGDGANGADHGSTYVTALNVIGTNGKTYPGGLYSSGGMTVNQMERVGRLLRGERVPHQAYEKLDMQKV